MSTERLPRWDDPPPAASLSQAELAEVLTPFRAGERLRAFCGAVALALVVCALAVAISAVAVGFWLGLLV